MKQISWHYFLLTALVGVLVLLGQLQQLNLEANLLGVVANCLMIAATLATGSLLIIVVLNQLPSKNSSSITQALKNSLVLSTALIVWVYGGYLMVFSWPFNTLRESPETPVNDWVVFVGLAMWFLSLAIWGLGAARTFQVKGIETKEVMG